MSADLAASALARLLNRSRSTGENYNLLLSRFVIERLLFRLSVSPHAGSFVLKGASARLPVQVDIGFGDAITPAPEFATYPTLLDGMDAPRLRAYPVYTVIAEKFHAMVELGINNSRMKDFFDLAVIARTSPLDGGILVEALHATFARRGTTLPSSTPIALTPEFAAAPAKARQWSAFVNKAQLQAHDLQEVVALLDAFLAPPTQGAASGQRFDSKWSPTLRRWT